LISLSVFKYNLIPELKIGIPVMMIEKSLHDLKALVRVSLGEIPPDLYIKGAEIADVYSGTLFRGNIWVYKHWIAYMGDKEPPLGEQTVVIDGRGKVASPGYVDAHGHGDLFFNPATFAEVAITKGATTVFSDAQDMVDAIGVTGFVAVLKAAPGFATKYLWSVPATYPPYPDVEGGELYSLEDVRMLFSTFKECVAVSELSSYMRILRNDEAILERMHLAESFGRNIEGHTLGASYDKLNTLAAAGITSCHESITGADLKNRVRLGLSAMIRHSSIRSDLEELCATARDLPKDSLMLVSDGIFADDLCEKGYMDYVVAEAMRYGLAPMDAIRMATLNPARYLKVDREVGSIAPGRIADILLLESLDRPTPLAVIEKGRLVAEEGRLLVSSAPFPDLRNRHYPYVFHKVESSDFVIETRGRDTVPVIDLADKTVTRRLDCVLPQEGGAFLPDKAGDIRKAVYTRRDLLQWGKGFVRGIGADIGGMATSVAHETHGLLVLGFDDLDMALAANEVLSMGGGLVLAHRGEIIHRLALPVGAIMSDLPIRELARELTRVKDLMRQRGSALEDPFLTATYLTLTSIIELRLTVSGVYDVKKGEIIF
jgi:adenine deaminase